MPTENFKSENAYRKWNAYRHIHGIPAPNLTTAVVAGVPHKVQHSSLSRPKPQAEKRLKAVEKKRRGWKSAGGG
ncbi:hypothetical protein KGP36_03285 [Patescibacteria group bacterium]|nr:hypothetical protein [Patescibacteria group bacterium]